MEKKKKQKRQKKPFVKKFFQDLRILPWYWKFVVSLLIFFVGGSGGMSLLTSADDFAMYGGYFLLAILLWVLIQIWLPQK